MTRFYANLVRAVTIRLTCGKQNEPRIRETLRTAARVAVDGVRYGLGLAALSLGAGCTTPNSATSLDSDSHSSFSVPVTYTDGLGVGAGAVEGSLMIAKSDVNKAASRAIVMALQAFEASIQEPRLQAGELLPQRRKWVSDRAPVPLARIRAHNELHPEMKLSEQFRYQMAYQGEYVVENRELIFRISALLFESAAAATEREYKRPYSGRFFVDALGKNIQSQLRESTAGDKP